MTCETVSVIQFVGDGTGKVSPDEISVEDIAVGISRPLGETDESGQELTERVWVAKQNFKDNLGIAEPDSESSGIADAVIVLSNLELPASFRDTPATDLHVEIMVSQLQTIKVQGCPRCGENMVETFEDGNCTQCGFPAEKDASPSSQDE